MLGPLQSHSWLPCYINLENMQPSKQMLPFGSEALSSDPHSWQAVAWGDAGVGAHALATHAIWPTPIGCALICSNLALPMRYRD